MKVGLGCGALGDPSAIDDAQATYLVRGALELGVRVFDTARSYGLSEERLRRALAGTPVRLSTKGGYGVEPIAEWTGEAISAGIERARRQLGVEGIEVFHLHSCPLEVLQRPGVIEALHEARAAGRIVRAGYSGDGAALQWAVESGAFDAVEASFSVFDQTNARALRAARAKGLWVIAKRALGGAVWERAPSDEATRAYRSRFEAMALTFELPWEEVAARFVAHAPEIELMLVGTTRLAHLHRIIDAVLKGPLPEAMTQTIRGTFERLGQQWAAQI